MANFSIFHRFLIIPTEVCLTLIETFQNRRDFILYMFSHVSQFRIFIFIWYTSLTNYNSLHLQTLFFNLGDDPSFCASLQSLWMNYKACVYPEGFFLSAPCLICDSALCSLGRDSGLWGGHELYRQDSDSYCKRASGTEWEQPHRKQWHHHSPGLARRIRR